MEPTTIVVSPAEPPQNLDAAIREARALRRRYLPWLIVAMLAASLPFVLSFLLPWHVTESIPRFFFVLYYGGLSLFAGWFGIAWIFRAARLAISVESERRVYLGGEVREKVLEVLNSLPRGTRA